MNQIQQQQHDQTLSACGNKKIKLNQLSKFIFQKIFENKQINDNDLMKLLIKQFGSVKQETLKRRKYDTVNILQKADIIVISKKESNFTYIMKHEVPNSVKDLQDAKLQLQLKQQSIRDKEKQLKMMRVATDNYRRLIEINQIRKKQQQTAIQLPIIAATEKFTYFISEVQNNKKTLTMKFPAGTRFINNMLAHSEIFNF